MSKPGMRCLAKELALAVAFDDEDIRNVKALIVGPPGTPYEFGLFEFALKIDMNYPTGPPAVKALTTGGGTTRFNPNIYANGTVCLSILGTWYGEPGEGWSPVQGIESVLISIQSLMSANPYENEPGYEGARPVAGSKDEPQAYKSKIHHETIRVAVLQALEEHFELQPNDIRPEWQQRKRSAFMAFKKDHSNSEQDQLGEIEGTDHAEHNPCHPFLDLRKRRFLWYYHSYQEGIDEMVKKGKAVKDGKTFARVSFESSSNGIVGAFNYTKLKVRLRAVREAIEKETTSWISQGVTIHKRDSPLSFSFQKQFEAIAAKYKRRSTPVEFELIKGNPFDWRIILFGQPMTNLEGGVFKIHMVISSKFPEEQPRVRLEAPLFHHRVSPDGVLCYFAEHPDDLISHAEAIIHAIEDDPVGFDPMEQVNPEASRLLFGGAESRKIYNRYLRRSAQAST